MKDVIFAVSPAGICGMDVLATFLNAMKTSGEITAWQPLRAESGSKNERYAVHFPSDQDAMRAESAWRQRRAERRA